MSIKEYLGLMGRPPIPAGGGDAWGQGIASGVQAFLASQPTLADQQKMRMERDFYDARTGLVREQTRAAQTEAAIKAIEMMGKQRQEQAATALPTAVEQFVKNGAPLDGGYEGPTQPLPFPKLFNTGLEATGGDPQKAIRLLMGALGDRATPELAHSLQYAAGNMPGLDQAPTFATQRQYRDERAAQETAKQQAEIKKAQIGAQSRLDAAAIRGPSGGGGESFAPVETQSGMMILNKRTGQYQPMIDPTTRQPIMGKAAAEKPATDAQANAYSLWERGNLAAEQLKNTLAKSYEPGGWDAFAYDNIPGAAGRWLTSADGQMYLNAEMSLINIIKRRDSGAAVTEQERQEFRSLYGALPGDTDELKAQKTANLLATIDTIGAGAGNLVKRSKYYDEYAKRNNLAPQNTPPQTGGMSEADINTSLRNARKAINIDKVPRAEVEAELRKHNIDPGRL